MHFTTAHFADEVATTLTKFAASTESTNPVAEDTGIPAACVRPAMPRYPSFTWYYRNGPAAYAQRQVTLHFDLLDKAQRFLESTEGEAFEDWLDHLDLMRMVNQRYQGVVARTTDPAVRAQALHRALQTVQTSKSFYDRLAKQVERARKLVQNFEKRVGEWEQELRRLQEDAQVA